MKIIWRMITMKKDYRSCDVDAQSAINDLTRKWLGSRQIRCNWATKGAGIGDEKQTLESKSVVELTNGFFEDGKEPTNSSDAPENNPQYTTVYVGNLAPEVMKTTPTHEMPSSHFHSLGAGVIEEVRVQRDKGFGFVRYNNHSEAALAIQMGNTQSIIYGKQIKCSWGSKPTPLGTSSNPLPPPVPAPMLSTADLLAYERQLTMSKMALMHPQGHQPLKQATMDMAAVGASQAIYDGGSQSVPAAQQLS
ncbi:hypothetical protein E3N88_44169 [Mikania micrantha]|uniref:RRM domain-containing protein n=1 Tax=Mikania micrantha TaxID=192012 RepID=A0A5N6LCT7_9ASTR|nr:hypothetical protein E3N88_44169 [Mikania micrantha]